MNLEQRLALSYYEAVSPINEAHQVYLVKHRETGKFYVKKTLGIYSKEVYCSLRQTPVQGIPGIAELYEEEGRLIIIEDFIPGTNLQEMIDAKTLTISKIIHYLTQLCEIVEQLHTHKPALIHRDIKPSNIIITPLDNVILLDFNAARVYSEEERKESDTQLLGTRGYAAPEQYGFGESSPQTDIYAIGMLLKETISSLSEKTPAFDPIILKCTQMDPARRYASAEALKAALLRNSTRMREEKSAVHSEASFLPPGFRSHSFLKMLIATIGYGLIMYFGTTLEVDGVDGGALTVERLAVSAAALSVVFIPFNYLDIQRCFPLCKHRSLVLRILGVILQTLLTVMGILVLMAIIILTFYPSSC